MINKSLIRQHVKQTTLNLTPDQKTTAAKKLTALVLSWEQAAVKSWRNFACYWPTKFEISTIHLINNLLNNNKNCYLSYINQHIPNNILNHNNMLSFVKYDLTTKLIANQFGILEPEFDINKTITCKDLELIFMPVVAFDSLGHRIGSGAGLYDRTLAEYRAIAQAKDINSNCPILIGLAYSIQQIEDFIPDPWDISLDIIITEQKIFKIRSGF